MLSQSHFTAFNDNIQTFFQRVERLTFIHLHTSISRSKINRQQDARLICTKFV